MLKESESQLKFFSWKDKNLEVYLGIKIQILALIDMYVLKSSHDFYFQYKHVRKSYMYVCASV